MVSGIKKRVKSLNQDRDFYRDSAYDLLGDLKWSHHAINTLISKLQDAYDHNELLLDKVAAYNGGLVDKDFVYRKSDQGKFQKYPYETYVNKVTSKPKQTIKLETIIDACKTDLQKQVVKFYYDKKLDSYGSKQKVANWLYPGDKHGRQKVNQILNTIAKYMTKTLKEYQDEIRNR